ncbi:lamin tail domain-containing protein [Pontiellaceae bacterium B1224]|nr:lamin tail domain-containing protein [Pontiellaceae bacterium B1224]
MKSALCIGLLLLIVASTADAATNHYLFVGHPRDDGPGQILQREVERIDFAQYELLMLGGDYAWSGTGLQSTVDYLDAVFNLGSPGVLAVLGNHDTANKSFFTDATGRPNYYTTRTNGIIFAVLDTTDDGKDILDGELQMLQDTVNSLSNATHLVVVHHHFIWMADYAPLAYLYGDDRIGASSSTLSGLNFYDDVYPLLQQAVSNGVEVVCVGGDRTGSDLEGTYGAFHIEHMTSDGIHYLAAGLKEELPPDLRTVIEFEHDTAAGILNWDFVPLASLPRIPDEPLVITELHYNPSDAQGNDSAFIELMNCAPLPYDLSEASFAQGVSFTFPTNTIVAPGERILVAANPVHYTNLGVRVYDYDGTDTPVSGEPIWLRDRDALEVDYAPYDAVAPWPPEPYNNGPSLMLIHPDLDNGLAANWAASDGNGGTPGAINFTPTTCTSLSVSNHWKFMDWSGTVGGGLYSLEWTPALTPTDWQLALEETNAFSNNLELAVTNSAPSGFYRLQRTFPVIMPPSYTNLISSGAVWKYRDTGDDPGADWMTLDYDDSGWASGPAELGYGDGDEATEVGYGPDDSSKYATTHFRHHFNVANPDLPGNDIRCSVNVDDGAILYLNGTEMARVRMQEGTVTYQDYTTEGGSDYGFEWVDLTDAEFIAGDNVLAVEVHQKSGSSSDISMDLILMVSEFSP